MMMMLMMTLADRVKLLMTCSVELFCFSSTGKRRGIAYTHQACSLNLCPWLQHIIDNGK